MGLRERLKQFASDFNEYEGNRRDGLRAMGFEEVHSTMDGSVDLIYTPPHGIPAVRVEPVFAAESGFVDDESQDRL